MLRVARLFLILFLAVVFFKFSTNSSFAATPTPQVAIPIQIVSPMQYRLNTSPDVPHNLNTYTQSVFIEILSTASCFLAGTNPINPQSKCLGVNQKTGKFSYIEDNTGGLVSAMGNMIGQTYNLPITSSSYVAYLASNFGITKKSYAQINGGARGSSAEGQGLGFIGLSSLIPVWTVFRNLSYLVLSLVFILLGLGIMFRVNVDARTVMTIQNQIPKIIIGLILITLSYAIAGFLVDLMYVITYLVINVFTTQGFETITNVNTNPFMAVGHLGALSDFAGLPAASIGKVVSSIFNGTAGTALQALVGGIIGAIVGGMLGPWGSIVGGLGGAATMYFVGDRIIQFVAMVIAFLVIIVAILSSLFRVWIMLIKAYVYILLSVIFAPFWILGGLLPMGIGGFSAWLKSLIANLAVFPTVILLFMIAKTIMVRLSPSGQGYNFTPPMIGNFGSDPTTSLGSIIGLGIILILPESLNLVKSVLKAPDLKISSAAARPLAVGSNFLKAPAAGAWGKLTGENARGEMRPLTGLVHRRIGGAAASLLGGSFKREKFEEEDKKTGETIKKQARWFGRARTMPATNTQQTTTPTNNSPENPSTPSISETDVRNRARRNVYNATSRDEFDLYAQSKKQEELDKARKELEDEANNGSGNP